MLARMLIAASLMLSCGSTSAAEPLPDLEQIQKAYLENVGSIHSLYCRQQAQIENNGALKKQVRADTVSAFEYQFHRHGRKRAVLTERLTPRGEVKSRHWVGYDGAVFATWTALAGEPETVEHLPRGRIQSDIINFLYPSDAAECFLGSDLYTGFIALSQLIVHDESRVAGWEHIGGNACVKVQFPRHAKSRQQPNTPRIDTVAWLDPTISFSPRQIELIDTAAENATPPIKYSEIEYKTVTGDDGRTFWFPSEGRFSSRLNNTKVKIIEVKINGRIEHEAFVPQFPDLTLVTEVVAGRKPRQFVVGDAARRAAIEEKRSAPDKITAPPSTSAIQPTHIAPPSARPDDVPSLWATLARVVQGVGLTVLLIAGFSYFRKSRS